MKKIATVLFLVIIIFGFTSCGDNEVTHIGVNAEILEINTELKGFVVKALDNNSVLGEKCYVSCENDKVSYIYVDNKTGKTKELSYKDFVVGDKITVDVNSVENSYTLTYRVQLITQRK